MAYSKTIWVNGETAAGATNMNKIENELEALDTGKQDNLTAGTNITIDQNNVISSTCELPIGSGIDYYGTTAPENYMFADGSAISRTTYAELFAVIGTTYGTGDGSTTFNLPDKRERVSVMYKENSTNGTTGATLGTLGAKGGEFTHEQTINELATHEHPVFWGEYPMKDNKSSNSGYEGSERTSTFDVNDTTSTSRTIAKETGGGQPMNIMQSYIVCNYIIKVK